LFSKIALLRVIDFLKAAKGLNASSRSTVEVSWEISGWINFPCGVNPSMTVLFANLVNYSLLILFG
jgi:hypothetical protein